mmetsp:Transcript_48861/g.78752  ORF Transcript_48861/g.78752 Transcript_48861/m.78752 type:complete len:87 (+) Transcript_48861:355-615(+)
MVSAFSCSPRCASSGPCFSAAPARTSGTIGECPAFLCSDEEHSDDPSVRGEEEEEEAEEDEEEETYDDGGGYISRARSLARCRAGL